MDQQSSDADGAGGLQDASGGVGDQGATDAFALECLINRQSAQHHHGDRVGHVAFEGTGRRINRDGAGGQGVIGDNPSVVTGDESAGGAAELVFEGALL